MKKTPRERLVAIRDQLRELAKAEKDFSIGTAIGRAATQVSAAINEIDLETRRKSDLAEQTAREAHQNPSAAQRRRNEAAAAGKKP